MDNLNIKDAVKERYRKAALRVNTGRSACCGATAAGSCGPDPITSNLYDASQTDEVPAEALLASLGCGNPTALAKLASGEVVLDIGSGGGMDVLLSAKRVGPAGKAYGLDMIDEMLALDPVSLCRFRFPIADGASLHLLHEHAHVIATSYTGDYCEVEAETPESVRRRLAPYLVERNLTDG